MQNKKRMIQKTALKRRLTLSTLTYSLIIFAFYLYAFNTTLQLYGRFLGVMALLIPTICLGCFLVPLHLEYYIRTTYFSEHILEEDIYHDKEGLHVMLRDGYIFIENEKLSDFLEFRTSDIYSFHIPYFNWSLAVEKSLINSNLKKDTQKPEKNIGKKVRFLGKLQFKIYQQKHAINSYPHSS